MKKLKNMIIKEISLVDEGANQREIIFKRKGNNEEISHKSGVIYVKKAVETDEETTTVNTNNDASEAYNYEAELTQVGEALDYAESVLNDENATPESKTEAQSIVDSSVEFLSQLPE